MKSLNDFVLEESIREYINEQLSEDLFLDDYLEKYCQHYNCELNDDILKMYKEDFTSISFYERAVGEDWYHFYLYETLINTLDVNKLINLIEKRFKKYDIRCSRGDFDSEYPQFKIIGNDINRLSDDEKFIELCNLSNYEIIKSIDALTIKPIKGKEVTNRVYKYPKIYHVTPKFIYEENIKNFGISPKGRSIQKPFNSKYKRIYCYYSKDPMKGARTFAGFKKRFATIDYRDDEELLNKYKEGYVLLTIKLNKTKTTMKFFEDSGQKGLNAFWTYDFIPHWCIEKVENIDLK